ncbi:MAG: YfhO family protein [Anaerorhabdus sp.]|uniref:YfhO family protein n=1 Tax=Anaerorhabdus sp. TaxID=1872524 RepID=UPI002FC7B726
MKKKEFKNIVILIALVLAICFFVYLPLVLNKIPFELSTIDTREQLFPFYNEFCRLLDNFKNSGVLPFYSWSSFLGNDFLVTKAFYLTTDITMYLAYFLKLHFWDALIFTTILKLTISSITMYFLLSYLGYSSKTKIVGSLCYVFCAQMSYYTVYPMYLNVFCLLPLYFLGIEKYIKDSKKYLFIIMTAILAISHFYFFFIISVFTIIYYLYRYYVVNQGFAKVVQQTVKIILYYFIGLSIAGFIFIPFVFFILGNDRVGLFRLSLIYDSIFPYLNTIASYFMPYHVFQTISYPFRTDSYVVNEVFLWSGTIMMLLVPQLFVVKEKLKRKANICLYVVLAGFLFFPFLNSIMHGFSENSFRFSILINLINIVLCCEFINEFDKIDKKLLLKTAIFASVVILLFVLGSLISVRSITEFVNKYQAYLLISGFTIIMIIAITWFLVYSIKQSKILLIGLVWIDLFVPLVYEVSFVPKNPDRNSYQFMEAATNVLEWQDNGLNNYLQSLSETNMSEYYRIYVDRGSLYWDISMNAPMFYDINGLSTYDTTHANSLNKLKELAPEINLADSKDFDRFLSVENYDLMTYLNTKYALVLDENQLPIGNWQLIVSDYLGFIPVYENMSYRPLGTSYSNADVYESFSGDYTQLFNTVYSNPNDYNKIQSLLGNDQTILQNIKYGGNSLYGTYSSQDDTFMIITIPYDKGWNIYVNGLKVDSYAVNGGFIGIPIPDGDNYIEMHYMPNGLKVGVICTGIGIMSFVILIIIDCVKRKHVAKSS